ncbi:hypothetical protein ACFSJW_08950 [Flavobacterium artemisiae]|uniref:Uncharacterized protein n=1 Tax=Flavobacterium artemisiae TaxID=2126556 RepID=A0ABW4HEZ4_9FLAO
MYKLKLIAFALAIFSFVVAIALTGSNLQFYFKNREMFHNTKQYSKEYVLMDSIFHKTVGQKTRRELYYGFSKKFDNYKTTFDLNTPDGSAVIENDITVDAVPDPQNESIFYYYAWVNKQKQIGFIANSYEETINDNWKYLDFLLQLKLNIGLLVFSLIVFYWLKVHYIFKKSKNTAS